MDWASDLARNVKTYTEAPLELYIHQRRWVVGQSYGRLEHWRVDSPESDRTGSIDDIGD